MARLFTIGEKEMEKKKSKTTSTRPVELDPIVTLSQARGDARITKHTTAFVNGRRERRFYSEKGGGRHAYTHGYSVSECLSGGKRENEETTKAKYSENGRERKS